MDIDPDGFVENAADKLGVLSHRVKADMKKFKHFIEERGRRNRRLARRRRPPHPLKTPGRGAPPTAPTRAAAWSSIAVTSLGWGRTVFIRAEIVQPPAVLAD